MKMNIISCMLWNFTLCIWMGKCGTARELKRGRMKSFGKKIHFFFAARTHKKKLFFSTTRLTTCVFEDVILLRFFFAIIHIYHGSFNSTKTFHMRCFFLFRLYEFLWKGATSLFTTHVQSNSIEIFDRDIFKLT